MKLFTSSCQVSLFGSALLVLAALPNPATAAECSKAAKPFSELSQQFSGATKIARKLAVEGCQGDKVSESWEAPSPKGDSGDSEDKCRLQHRELEYSYPELIVSIPTSEAEREGDAFAGLSQIQGMSHDEFKQLLFGETDTQWSGSKGLFTYEGKASGSRSSGSRLVTFTGVPKPDREGDKPVRKVVLEIEVIKDRISVKVTHLRKGWFGWKEVYSGSCGDLEKVKNTGK